MELFFGIFFSSIVVEGVITYIKTFFVNGKPSWQILIGIALGLLTALAYRLDLFALAGLTETVTWLSWVGRALTGILIARGSNYLFDLIKLLGNLTGRLTAEQ